MTAGRAQRFFAVTRRFVRDEEAARDVVQDALLPRFDEAGHHARPVAPWRSEATASRSRDDRRERVLRAVDRLPATCRTVLLLRDIEEHSTEETARLLGATPTAVKVRLHRARQAVRTRLEPSMTA